MNRLEAQNVRKTAMQNNEILIYRSEDDRCYGLAGMAIALGSLDVIDRVAEIYLDADGPMVIFSNEFFFNGSQSVSPKSSWKKLVENYQITTALAIANVLSRRLVREKAGEASDMLNALFATVAEEGHLYCELDDDEINTLFQKTLAFSRRIFGNPRLYPLVDRLSQIIATRRRLSGREIAEELHYLQLY